MIFSEISCKAENSLKKIDSLGIAELVKAEAVGICTITQKSKVYIDACVKYNENVADLKSMLDCIAMKIFKLEDKNEVFNLSKYGNCGFILVIPIRAYYKYKVFCVFYNMKGFTKGEVTSASAVLNLLYKNVLLYHDVLNERNYLNSLFNSLESIVIGLDKTGVVTSGNKAVEKIFKMNLQDILGNNFIDLKYIKGKRNIHEIINKVIRESRSYIVKEEIFMLEGEKVFMDMVFSPVNNSNGEIEGIVIVMDDITDRKMYEKENEQLNQFKKLIGNGKEIKRVKKIIEKIKDLDTIVLLTGESGTGKGVLAREIFYRSNRREMPFIHVNCAALPENLIESELFGHEKGAFTGANETKIGKFESARNGTIFLDEIGALDLNLQAKLLIVLQEKSFERIGSSQPRKLEARVIAATNINLEDAVQKKIFREDLYYRLNVVRIECSPLRYRKDEIEELSLAFIENISKRFKKKILSVSNEIWEIFNIYNWPGNIRELENTLESSIALASDERLKVNDLPIRIIEKVKYIKKTSQVEESNVASETAVKKFKFEEQEIRRLKEALYRNNGHREKTANYLNISRRTLQYKLKKYGLI